MSADNSDVLTLDPTGFFFLESVYRYRRAQSLVARASRIVDATCGYGYGTNILSEGGGEVIGLDRDEEALAVARQRYPALTFTAADLGTVTLPPCEVVVTIETVEHLRDPLRWIAECKRVAQMVVVSTPCIPDKHNNVHHLHDFTIEEVQRWFRDWRQVWLEVQSNFFMILAFVR